MIETHLLDIGLASVFKTGWLYDALNHSNASVAVGFLFCAGAGFWISAERRFDDFRSFSKPLGLYLRRLGFILLVAYWLNLPFGTLHKTLENAPRSLMAWATCDVLHVIVIASLVSLVLLRIMPSLKSLAVSLGLAALLVYFVAPILWYQNPISSLPIFLQTFFSKPPVAKFPLFPWMGHFFLGAFVTALILQARRQKLFAGGLLLTGAVIPTVALWVMQLPFVYWGTESWWYCSPGNSFLRVSRVLIVFAALFLSEEGLKKVPKISGFFQTLGQESLFAYVTHLAVIYGTILNPGMRWLGLDGFSPIIVAGMYITLVTAVYLGARSWQKYKESTPQHVRMLMNIFFGIFAIWFLVARSTPLDYFTSRSSTSNIRLAFGGMAPPAPRAP
jgi:uncharacterized membrane protein